MMPFLEASGHNNYTKSASIYLENMKSLQTTNSQVYKSLIEGYQVIRRSNRFCAGLSMDLDIEQVLTRSIKANGGLT